MRLSLLGIVCGLGVTVLGTLMSAFVPNGGGAFAAGVGVAVSGVLTDRAVGKEVKAAQAVAQGALCAVVLVGVSYWLGIGMRR